MMDDEKSEMLIVLEKQGNACGGKGHRIMNFLRKETHKGHRTMEDVYTKLQRIADLAARDKKVQFTSLAHILTPQFLKDSFYELNQKAAPGTDGITMEMFKADIDLNIDTLWLELRKMKYRSQPVRRVYIPKANGDKRPLGIPAVRDRVAQRALGKILSTIYEQQFLSCSYGFRPGRSTHDALEALRGIIDKQPVHYIVEADIKSYFDKVNHEWLREFLKHRIADTTIHRLIGKWLKSGIMENGVVCRNKDGTPQGGPISPLLANIYLHYVLDLWVEHSFRKTVRGVCSLIRYADDFVVCFEFKDEAERFMEELRKRFEKFHLELSEEKTQLIEFGKDSNQNGERGPSNGTRTFDFLGFAHYMRKKGKRGYRTARKPSKRSRNKFLRSTKEWLRKCMHTSVWFQAKVLARKLKGYYNYFGLRYCKPSLKAVKWHVERMWVTILQRRSQRHKLYWHQVTRKRWFYSLPKPKLR